MQEDILIPLGLFAMISLIVYTVTHFRSKNRAKTMAVLEKLIDNNKEISPDIIKAVGIIPKRAHADLRTSFILIAIGFATMILGQFIPDKEANAVFGGLSMFPILIGIALLAYWYLIGRKAEQ